MITQEQEIINQEIIPELVAMMSGKYPEKEEEEEEEEEEVVENETEPEKEE